MTFVGNYKTKEDRITAVNFHIIGSCNCDCKMCFSRGMYTGYMMPEEYVPVLKLMKEIGIEKINFAGGEPTLYPYLRELAELTHHMGFYVSIVSNGSRIDERWLQEMKGIIDCIGISIDSPDENDEILIGRHVRGMHHVDNAKKMLKLAKRYGYRTKLNIVVNGFSCMKDFGPLIEDICPDRIKAFRVLELKGTNDDMPEGMHVTDEQFDTFRRNHLNYGIAFEDNEDMTGTYLMFDPRLNLMDNRKGKLELVPFSEVVRNGIETYVDPSRFGSRQDIYWRGPRIAVFGTSRSGKDYSIRDAREYLSAEGYVFSHISPISLVHSHLGDRRLKNMSCEEKKALVNDVRNEIKMISTSGSVFIDEHYSFPNEFGGQEVENGYSDEKLPYIEMTDDKGGMFECVFDPSWIRNYDLVLYMDIPSDVILDRFRTSEGCKNNPYVTMDDIDQWKAFELSELEKLCSNAGLRMVRITNPERSGEQIGKAVLDLMLDK